MTSLDHTTTNGADTALLRGRGLRQRYRLPRTRLFGPREELIAVDNIDIAINPGEAVGIVGESGSGKSTLTRILVGDERPTEGTLTFDGIDVWSCTRTQYRTYRRSVQVVLQNPRSSLDPRMRIGTSLLEPLRALKVEGNHHTRVLEILEQVGMGEDTLRKYPHQFSGGQLQRIAIARALAPHPRILIADEPVSALDVSIQAQVLNLLKDLIHHLDLTLILIAHDLSVVAYTTDRVAVMANGHIVEQGQPTQLFNNPTTQATHDLVDAVLTVETGLEGKALH